MRLQGELARIKAAVAHAEVGQDPDKGDGGVESDGEGGMKDGDGNGKEIEGEREPVFALGRDVDDSALLCKAETVIDGKTKKHEREAGGEQGQGVEDDGEAVSLFFEHPGGEVGKQRSAEEEEEVAVQNASVHDLGAADEQVVIDPIDADKGEGEDVDKEDGENGTEAGGTVCRRNLQLEHHDGDDDGEDAIGEGLETGRGEGSLMGFLVHGNSLAPLYTGHEWC